MRIFLVDFENLRSEALRGIDLLTEEDKVIIFYSNNADTLTFTAHALIMGSKAQIVYYKINRGGKNALDFQLVSCLGYMLAKEPAAEYYIISRDNGYDFAREFWADNFVGLNFHIIRCYTIKYALNRRSVDANVLMPTEENEPMEELTEEIETIELPISTEQISTEPPKVQIAKTNKHRYKQPNVNRNPKPFVSIANAEAKTEPQQEEMPESEIAKAIKASGDTQAILEPQVSEPAEPTSSQDEALAETKTAKPRRRGRPRKKPADPAEPSDPTKDAELTDTETTAILENTVAVQPAKKTVRRRPRKKTSSKPVSDTPQTAETEVSATEESSQIQSAETAEPSPIPLEVPFLEE